MSSRLGEPIRKRASGLSRFASPIALPPTDEEEASAAAPPLTTDVLISKHQNIATEDTPSPPPMVVTAIESPARSQKPRMRKKVGTTIRLTPTAIERLAQLEINARR